MILQEAHNKLINKLLAVYENREASNIADILTEHITGYNRTDRIIHHKTTITTQQEEEYKGYSNRLLKHEPIQYITSNAWFYNYPFYVNRNVLIPRPETEELVDRIIKEYKGKAPTVLDIGTGSGCIAISLQKKIGAYVTGIDVSAEALNISQQNADNLGADINLKLINFIDRNQWESLGMFDIIVSNPPYIKFEEIDEISNNVLQYEPHLALFVENNDPLIFYRMIALFARTHLNRNGTIWMEINERLSVDTMQLMKLLGYQTLIFKDMQGKERIIKATLNY